MITECISTMRTIAVVPDGTVCTHHNHSINKSSPEQPPIKIKTEKENSKRYQAKHFYPVEERKPVFPGSKNIETGKELLENSSRGRFYKAAIRMLPSI